jgi:predicted nucleic acid-binding protein
MAARYEYHLRTSPPEACSESRRLRPVAAAEACHLSVATFAEIRFGIELPPEAMRRSELNDSLTHKVQPMFEQRMLAISEDIMFKWRILLDEDHKAGHTFSQRDLIIAATAQWFRATRRSMLLPVLRYSTPGLICC